MRLVFLFGLLAIRDAAAHYNFPRVDSTSDWQAVRRAGNWQSNGHVSNVQSEQIRCFQTGMQPAAMTENVRAGGTLTYHSNQGVFHAGPMSAWMAKVPAGKTAMNFDGSGNVWFKIYQEPVQMGGGGMTWSSLNKQSFQFTIPQCLADGEYLFRIEHNALHNAGSAGGAQFYVSCAQINVSGGSGAKQPSNLVSFPGAYKTTDPGILINIYNARGYTPAGGAPFTC